MDGYQMLFERLKKGNLLTEDQLRKALSVLTLDEKYALERLLNIKSKDDVRAYTSWIHDRMILKSGEIEALERKQKTLTTHIEEKISKQKNIFFRCTSSGTLNYV